MENKARVVVKGFLQKEGINFEEVFTPVTIIDTIWLVVGIVNDNNGSIYQMDVKSAILNKPLEEDVYLEQPSCFIVKNQESKFYRLKKALNGLKQALRAWNKRINGLLKETGFNKCVSEHGVYVKKDANKGMVILCLYVDDFFYYGHQWRLHF